MGAAQSTVEAQAAPASCPVPEHVRKAQTSAAESAEVAKEGQAGQGNACPFQYDSKSLQTGDVVHDTDPNPETPLLTTKTMVSSIPKAGGDGEYWVYPSPQRWYNAVKKKEQNPVWGFDPSQHMECTEDAVPTAVYIHNALNEQAWKEILEYEELHKEECGNPRLRSFRGRAMDYTPKARILNLLGMAPLPFDRHDWIVDRCGRDQRYVIDYYAEPTADPDDIPNIFIDVRPALTLSGAYDRLRMYFKRRNEQTDVVLGGQQ